MRLNLLFRGCYSGYSIGLLVIEYRLSLDSEKASNSHNRMPIWIRAFDFWYGKK